MDKPLSLYLDKEQLAALGALTALLLGLVGSVIGGWMASGEPMTFTHYRTRRVVR